MALEELESELAELRATLAEQVRARTEAESERDRLVAMINAPGEGVFNVLALIDGYQDDARAEFERRLVAESERDRLAEIINRPGGGRFDVLALIDGCHQAERELERARKEILAQVHLANELRATLAEQVRARTEAESERDRLAAIIDAAGGLRNVMLSAFVRVASREIDRRLSTGQKVDEQATDGPDVAQCHQHQQPSPDGARGDGDS